MVVIISLKLSVTGFMGYWKGKRSLMIFDRYKKLKYKYRNRQFWCNGYFMYKYIKIIKKNCKILEYVLL